jgi:hypothetical protein
MARDYQDKENVAAAPDSIIATKHGGGEITSKQKEIKNAVSPTGQTLAPADGTAEKFNQLAQALFINATGAQTFQDSGAADAYVVTPVTGSGGLVVPDDYDNMNGAMISFIPSNANTGASTLDLGQTGGSLLGTKKILSLAGAALTGGELGTTHYHEFRYDTAADGAVGAWLFIGKKAGELYNAYAKYSETQVSTTQGGGATSGSWITRTLNLEDSDDHGIGSLAANQITLSPGTYYVRAASVFEGTWSTKTRIHDVTTDTKLAQSLDSNGSGDSTGESMNSIVAGQFTISGPADSDIELQYQVQQTRATSGLGSAASFAGEDEIYSNVEIWRVA